MLILLLLKLPALSCGNRCFCGTVNFGNWTTRTEVFVISTEVAIMLAVVAVAIIGVVAFMVLRKRK